MSHQTTPVIPIDIYPDPTVAYTIDDGTAVVTTVNDAFERVFDGPTPETVSEVLDRFRGDSSSLRGARQRVLDGEPIEIYLDEGDGKTYFARNVPTDDGAGFLVMSDLGATPATETVGLDHVASIVSHDLRNPLDVAKAHLQAAAETGDEEHFSAVSKAHDRMEHIVRDVLTLARGRDAIDASTQVSIEDVVEDAWRSVETDGATLLVDDPLPTTQADPDRVRRVFENLFRNALEHGSAHSDSDNRQDATVEIRVGPLENGFYVSDDGSGIPEDERDTVFEAGYTTYDHGTGLGLAIVKEIVEAHGWEITLTDTESGGARFEIQFDRQTDA